MKHILLIISMIIISVSALETYPMFTVDRQPVYTATIDTVIISSNNNDVELLARLIYCEAGNQPYEGKLAVANVVINRMENHHMSLSEVIFRSGQFDGVGKKYFYKEPTEECLNASRQVLNGYRILPTAMEYYLNPDLSTDRKWVDKLYRKHREWMVDYLVIGDHVFFYNYKLFEKLVKYGTI